MCSKYVYQHVPDVYLAACCSGVPFANVYSFTRISCISLTFPSGCNVGRCVHLNCCSCLSVCIPGLLQSYFTTCCRCASLQATCVTYEMTAVLGKMRWCPRVKISSAPHWRRTDRLAGSNRARMELTMTLTGYWARELQCLSVSCSFGFYFIADDTSCATQYTRRPKREAGVIGPRKIGQLQGWKVAETPIVISRAFLILP